MHRLRELLCSQYSPQKRVARSLCSSRGSCSNITDVRLSHELTHNRALSAFIRWQQRRLQLKTSRVCTDTQKSKQYIRQFHSVHLADIISKQTPRLAFASLCFSWPHPLITADLVNKNCKTTISTNLTNMQVFSSQLRQPHYLRWPQHRAREELTTVNNQWRRS